LLRFLSAFLPPALLGLLVGQANHALAPWHVWLYAGGLMVAFAALRLGFGAGFAAVFCAGLCCDAGAPLPFGTQAFLFAAAFTLIFAARDRLPREDAAAGAAVAVLANLGIFLALCLLPAGGAPATAWPRLLADLFFSQVFLVLAAPWFFALQLRLVTPDGVELRHTARGRR
jgi:rod shape-determining protein MreD